MRQTSTSARAASRQAHPWRYADESLSRHTPPLSVPGHSRSWFLGRGSACAAPGSAAVTQMPPPRGGGLESPTGAAVSSATPLRPAPRLAGPRAAQMPLLRARRGLLALLLLLAGSSQVQANKKSEGSASAALWAAKVAGAASAATQSISASGQAAAGPTASASELQAVEAPATTGPGARVGYLKLMDTPLTDIDPQARGCWPCADAKAAQRRATPLGLTRRWPPCPRARRLFATTALPPTSTSARARTPRSGWSTWKAACGACWLRSLLGSGTRA